MALKPEAEADTAALLAEIVRLYREAQALPIREQPDYTFTNGRTRRGSLAYQRLERQIRILAREHWARLGVIVDAKLGRLRGVRPAD